MKNKKIFKSELVEKVKELHKRLGRKPMKRDDSSLNYYAKKLFGSWNNLMKATGFPVRFYQKINSMKLDEDFAYFLGLLITDGHIYYNKYIKRYKVAIYTSYPEEKEMILKLIKEMFNYNAAVSSRMYSFNKKPNYEIRISSKKLAEFLISSFSIPPGAKSLKVQIPLKILESSQKIKKAFLRGIIDGDGSISKNSVKIASGSIDFLKGLRNMLNGINISSGGIIKENKNTNTYSIRINKKEDLIKIKRAYHGQYFYKRKKEIIGKV